MPGAIGKDVLYEFGAAGGEGSGALPSTWFSPTWMFIPGPTGSAYRSTMKFTTTRNPVAEPLNDQSTWTEPPTAVSRMLFGVPSGSSTVEVGPAPTRKGVKSSHIAVPFWLRFTDAPDARWPRYESALNPPCEDA